MNLLDAITTILEATVEMDDRTEIRQARKRLQERADALRVKREKMATPKCNCGTYRGAYVAKCKLTPGHSGDHWCDGYTWPRTQWETTT